MVTYLPLFACTKNLAEYDFECQTKDHISRGLVDNCLIAFASDGTVWTTWKLANGWQKDVLVTTVSSRMVESMQAEAVHLAQKAVSKQAGITTLDDLTAISRFMSATFNDRHGKWWHCVVGQANMFTYSIWPNTDSFISLDVNFPAADKSLQLLLFKVLPNEWFYPVGWKDSITVDIVKSEMSEEMSEAVKRLVLQAVSRQEKIHTSEDMKNMAEFMAKSWEKTQRGYWQVIVGERHRYNWSIQKMAKSCIFLTVRLLSVKEMMRIVMFKAQQDISLLAV